MNQEKKKKEQPVAESEDVENWPQVSVSDCPSGRTDGLRQLVRIVQPPLIERVYRSTELGSSRLPERIF